MNKIHNTLRSLALLFVLVAVTTATAQNKPLSPNRIFRNSQHQIVLEFSEELSSGAEAMNALILLANGVVKSLPANSIKVSGNSLTFTISESLEKEIDELLSKNRESRLYLNQQNYGTTKFADSLTTIPRRLGLELRSFNESENAFVVIVRFQAGEEIKAALGKNESWQIGEGATKLNIKSVECLPKRNCQENSEIRGLRIYPETRPARGEEIPVVFNAEGVKLELGEITLDSRLEPCKTDPRCEADAFVGINITSSGGKAPVFQFDLLGGPSIWHNTNLSLNAAWEVKANSTQQDDENVLNLGLAFEGGWLVNAPKRLPRSIAFSISPKFENDRRFKNSNFVFDSKLSFNLGPWIPRLSSGQNDTGSTAENKDDRVAVKLKPYIGFDFGRNLRNEIRPLEGDLIRRLKGGGYFETKFKLDNPNLKHVTFQVGYNHYQLFDEERFTKTVEEEVEESNIPPSNNPNILSQRTLIERKLIATRRKGPRHYVNANLLFGLTDQFDLKFTYAYGEQPPTFQKVNKFQAGFGYRFNFWR